MSGIYYVGSGTLVINSTLNVDALGMLFYIGLPKPLLRLQLLHEGEQAEPPYGTGSLGRLSVMKGKRS